jgi:hypothetical protein
MRASIKGGTEQRLERILDLVDRCEDLAIEEFVRAVQMSLRIEDARPPSNKKENVNYATKVLRWIDEGSELLSTPPEGFNALTLFAPEEQFLPRLIADKRWEAVNVAQLNADKRWDKLREHLSLLRDRCKWISTYKIGSNANVGYRQVRAARAAWMVMKRCNLPILYSDSGSRYCRIAALFYEELTGEADKEIRRACERVARIHTEKRPRA